MHPIAAAAEQTLLDHPDPALRLEELASLIAERVDRNLDCVRLRSVLEGHPDHFRLLDPWRGAWREALREAGRSDPTSEMWVIAIARPGGPGGDPGAPAMKLKESVRWLARGTDPRSPEDVTRWYAIAIAERAIRASAQRRAA